MSITMIDVNLMQAFEVRDESIAKKVCTHAMWTMDDWPKDRFSIMYRIDFFGKVRIYLHTHIDYCHNVDEEQCREHFESRMNEFKNLVRKVEELIKNTEEG